MGKFRQESRGVETLRVNVDLGELRCSALSKVDRLGITVKREPAGWLKEHDRGSVNRGESGGVESCVRREDAKSSSPRVTLQSENARAFPRPCFQPLVCRVRTQMAFL